MLNMDFSLCLQYGNEYGYNIVSLSQGTSLILTFGKSFIYLNVKMDSFMCMLYFSYFTKD